MKIKNIDKFILQSKPCPNCGNHYSMKCSGNASDNYYYIRCVDCGETGRLTSYEFDSLIETIDTEINNSSYGLNICGKCNREYTATFEDINDKNINHVLCLFCNHISTF